MTLCDFGITSQMIPSQSLYDGYVYHIGLEVLYVIGLLVGKEFFYLEPQLSTLLLKKQEILMFTRGSVIIMALWKMHLEASNLVLVWMDMTPSLMMMKRVLLRVNPTRRDIKDLQIHNVGTMARCIT